MSKINPNDFIKLTEIVDALTAAAEALDPEQHPEAVLKVTEALKNAQLVQQAKTAGSKAQADMIDTLAGKDRSKKQSLTSMQVTWEMSEDACQREYRRVLDPDGKLAEREKLFSNAFGSSLF